MITKLRDTKSWVKKEIIMKLENIYNQMIIKILHIKADMEYWGKIGSIPAEQGSLHENRQRQDGE